MKTSAAYPPTDIRAQRRGHHDDVLTAGDGGPARQVAVGQDTGK
ncbi:hypothetical protein [Rhodococcus koreensis]